MVCVPGIKIDFAIGVFEEYCLAPITTLRDMIRQPGDHNTRQSCHN